MKAAKAKEAASLPRRPEPARGAIPQDLEQKAAPEEAESAALLQACVYSRLGPSSWPCLNQAASS